MPARKGAASRTVVSANSVVINASELDRMMNRVTNAAQAKTASDAETLMLQKAAKSRDRKARMMALEAERKKKGLERQTELQRQQAEANADVLAGAQRMLDENHDDVKKMNSMMLYAKCVAIRDRQIAEKEELQELRRADERRIELQMEAERRKAIADQERREEARERERKAGARMIRKQMKELEERRQRALEEKYQEGQRMLERIAANDEADRKAEEKRLEAGRPLVSNIFIITTYLRNFNFPKIICSISNYF